MTSRITKRKREELSRQRESQSPIKSSHYNFIPQTPRSSRWTQPLVLLGNGSTLTQRPGLPIPRFQIGLQERPRKLYPDIYLTNADNEYMAVNQDFADSLDPIPPASPSRHYRKRYLQTQRWQAEVLPHCLQPYMQLMRETKNLRDDPVLSDRPCSCEQEMKRLKSIIIVQFHKLERLSLQICPCKPISVLLVERGLFPCAPLEPSLAVDMRVLDFVTRLFLRISPNHTAWASTVEDFLQQQGYYLSGEDPLRRRFSNALQWYNTLQQETTKFVDSILTATRATLAASDVPVSDVSSNLEQRSSADGSDSSDGEQAPLKRHRLELPPLTRPSEYLRAACPICFGGKPIGPADFDAMVCADACFTQKHNKQKARDPPRTHPKTVFIPESDTQIWAEFVENCRSKKARKEKQKESSNGGDVFEPGLNVPNSILDICHDSFTAADETRAKASTQFFDCTAVMGLLCRHDRVLWLVNMSSPGERQHYVYALIDRLFQNLPTTFTVGILYDIGCSIHRSCVKWSFLDSYLDHITFAISVFHAYGHAWACQCEYHPRKHEGFGLTDGEGCERFWHSISKLIAYLRICGFHHRIYTLDAQVEHAAQESLTGLGKWIARKWMLANNKRLEAQKKVQESGKSPQFLREQWAHQKMAQTRPLPRQNKNAGKMAIETAVRMRKARDSLRDRRAALQDTMDDPFAEPYEVAEAEVELEKVKSKLEKATEVLSKQEANLGVDGVRQYHRMASNPFFTLRMNARALKIRLRGRLTSRKFEWSRVERSVRQRKIQTHTEDSVKRRDPGLVALARSYNKLQEQMVELKNAKRAPPNAVIPPPIPTKNLFDLDVDDAIWEDIGLDDSTDVDNPPLWLSDEDVRNGIKGVLLQDRCDEELRRLRYEHHALRNWMAEEWQIVNDTMEVLREDPDEKDLLYQVSERRKSLLLLCVRWVKDLSNLPFEGSVPQWGPTDGELEQVSAEMNSDLLGVVEVDDASDESDFHLDENELDAGLVEQLDALQLAGAEPHMFDVSV